jgi:hypothetical protein
MVHANVKRAIGQMRRGVARLKPEDLLCNKGLDADDARAIAAELEVNTTLTELNLWDNPIGDAGAASLADALRANTALALLILYKNLIGDAGATALAEVLAVNTTLTELNLFKNLIGDAGAASLADAFRINTTLTMLNLGSNSIGDAGSAALTAAVDSNPLVLVPLTEAQRWAFFAGHLRRPSQQSPLTKLPLEVVRRILTRYKVAQGRRERASGKIRVCPAEF